MLVNHILKEKMDYNPKYVLSLDKKCLSTDKVKHMNIIDFLLCDEF